MSKIKDNFICKIKETLIIKRRFSTFSSINKFTKRFLLTKIIKYNFLQKRNMFSIGKILSGSEKEAVSKILFTAKNFLKKQPLQDQDMVNLTVQLLVISPQVAQHFLAVSFPKYKMPLEIANKIPRVSFDSSSQTKIGLDQIISACAMVHRDKNPLLKDGILVSLGNRNLNSSIEPKTSIAYKNTSQEEPDYIYHCFSENTNEIFWVRYYDWKTGEITPNSGNILGTSDLKMFETLSETLLKKQMKFYYKKEPEIGEYLENLIKNQPNLTWGEKNFEFQLFLKENLQRFGPEINPSFIFKTVQFANAENCWKSPKYKMIEGSLQTDCFDSKISSELTIAKTFMLGENTSIIFDNYKSTRGHSSQIAEHCKNLWKEFL